MNYMIAYDFSVDAENALATTIRTMNRSMDHLYIATVSENLGKKYGVFGKIEQMKEAQDHIEQETKDKLNTIIKSACLQGVANCTGLLVSTNHIGEGICHAAKDKNIDVLVMGRRGISTVKRMLIGSNSKYCIEHAHCNVFVIKSNPSVKTVDSKKKATATVYEKQQGKPIVGKISERPHTIEVLQY